jgi:hypothetical protein
MKTAESFPERWRPAASCQIALFSGCTESESRREG